MKAPTSAMVLAAGLGRRMRPLTATRPKPLIEVGGRTLLDHALALVAAAGVSRVVVNVHYMADRIEAHLAARQDSRLEILVSDERSGLLDTGGGVAAARAAGLIEGDPFLVINTDQLIVDGPRPAVAELCRQWDAKAMDALLLVVPWPRACGHEGLGDFHMAADGRLERRRRGRPAPFIHTGLQLVSARLFEGAPKGAFSFNLLWDRALEAGRLKGIAHSGFWFDVGTPRALAEAKARLGHG